MGVLPSLGRIAAVDYGTVRVGVAVSDPERRIASPLASLSRGTPQSDARWFADLVAREEIVGFVVGLPVGSGGGETQKSREARRFGEWLAEATDLPVAYFDERYTTVEADAILSGTELTSKRRKQRRDMLAAQVLLTAFLESTTPQQEPGALED